MSKRYLSVTDVSKLLRASLKAAFPGVKFSVRSRGAIDVEWIDGPPAAAVERVAKRYGGSYFDGQIDYQGSIYHHLDGEPVNLLSTFVFVKRELSAPAMEAGIANANAAGAYGVDGLAVASREFAGKSYHYLQVPTDHSHQVGAPNGQGLMHPVAAIGAWFDLDRPAAELEPVSMVEADRLQIVGDDGYGAGRGEAGYPRAA